MQNNIRKYFSLPIATSLYPFTTMKNSKKETVITGKMVVKAAMIIALIATVGMMIYGIVTADARLMGEVSLFACVETGYWSATVLEERKKENEAKKNEIVA